MRVFIKSFIIILIGILLSAIVLGLLSLKNGWTTLDFSALLNKTFDFSLSLVSFLVAFSIGQVFWDKKLKDDKSILLRQLALTYIKRIESLSIQTYELLQPVNLGEESEIEDHNLLSVANFVEINKLCEVYIAIFGQLSTKGDASLIEYFFENIHPLVSRLMAYKDSHINTNKIKILNELIYHTNHFPIYVKE